MSSDQIAIIALVIACLDIFATFVMWLVNNSHRKIEARIKVYEEIYPEIINILTYPALKMKSDLNTKQYGGSKYKNSSPDFQKAVRDYLDADFFDRFWNTEQFIPEGMTNKTSIKRFLQVVGNEAQRFEAKKLAHISDQFQAKFSPVYYFEDPKIEKQITKILKHIGKNLTSFGAQVRADWLSCRYKSPHEVLLAHQENLSHSPRFYELHPGELNDPYFSLITNLNDEYNSLHRSWKAKYFLKIEITFWRTKNRIRKLFYQFREKK